MWQVIVTDSSLHEAVCWTRRKPQPSLKPTPIKTESGTVYWACAAAALPQCRRGLEAPPALSSVLFDTAGPLSGETLQCQQHHPVEVGRTGSESAPLSAETHIEGWERWLISLCVLVHIFTELLSIAIAMLSYPVACKVQWMFSLRSLLLRGL